MTTKMRKKYNNCHCVIIKHFSFIFLNKRQQEKKNILKKIIMEAREKKLWKKFCNLLFFSQSYLLLWNILIIFYYCKCSSFRSTFFLVWNPPNEVLTHDFVPWFLWRVKASLRYSTDVKNAIFLLSDVMIYKNLL